MPQIFFLGSSSAYGVGGENGSWADLVKGALHKKMYGDNGIGQKYEVYNFAKSGAKIDFVQETFPKQLADYGRGRKTIAIVCVGGNNVKAEDRPDNFVSTLESYADEMAALLDLLQKSCTHVIVVGNGYFDESKTNPILNPLTGGISYFTNARSQQFQTRCGELCSARGIPYVTVGVNEKEWQEKYVYIDGLHPNALGHELLSNKVMAELEKVL